jgi:rhamnulokinase
VSKDVLSACKVKPKRFPSVVASGTKLAKLTEDVAQATGLGRIPVVAVAGHDLASSVAILPTLAETLTADSSAVPDALSSAEGAAFLRIGPVSELGVETTSPIVNDQTYEMNFSNEAGVAGANLLLKRIVGTDLLSRCLTVWSAAGQDYSPEDVARMASEGAPTAAQLDPEDPALRSAPDAPAAIARFCSLRSMTAPADNAATVRLIYSSMAEKIGDTFVKLQSVTPFRLRSLRLIGDWSADPVFCQMVADECAVPVVAVTADAAVLGNVLVQSGVDRPTLTRQSLSVTLPTVPYTPSLT